MLQRSKAGQWRMTFRSKERELESKGYACKRVRGILGMTEFVVMAMLGHRVCAREPRAKR